MATITRSGPTAAAAYSTYSGAQVTTAGGTIATSPIVARQWYNAAASNSKVTGGTDLSDLYPLTLNAAGANRDLGTISIYATGLGGTSACRVVINWKELR